MPQKVEVLSSLQLPTEQLLSLGGDDRLTIDANHTNKYFSSTFPAQDLIARGSCTCSTVTAEVKSEGREGGVKGTLLVFIISNE